MEISDIDSSGRVSYRSGFSLLECVDWSAQIQLGSAIKAIAGRTLRYVDRIYSVTGYGCSVKGCQIHNCLQHWASSSSW